MHFSTAVSGSTLFKCLPIYYSLNYHKSSLFSTEMLREDYMLTAVNLKGTRDRQPGKMTKDIPEFKVGDLVLVRNDQKKMECKVYGTFEICKIINDRAYDLQD